MIEMIMTISKDGVATHRSKQAKCKIFIQDFTAAFKKILKE